MRGLAALASIALALAIGAGPARAHDPFEITTDARLRDGDLAVRTTMAGSTAARACLGGAGANGMAPARIARADWERVRPSVETCARALHRVIAGGRALEPRAASAAFTDENDVEMSLSYPRPPPGPLRIEAPYLAKLGDPTYGTMVTVTADGAQLGWRLLRADGPAVDVEVPDKRPRRRMPGILVFLVPVGAAAVFGALLARRARRR